MVRDYGIYARTVRNKVHALGAEVLAGLQRAAQRVRELMGRQSAARPEPSESANNQPVTGPFAERAVRCLRCGTEMILVRVWSASGGVLYDLWDNEAVPPGCVTGVPASTTEEQPLFEQLLFGFGTG